MKVAFASCAKIQDYPDQPAWKRIEDEEPDYLLLLGDNVYAPNKGLHLDQLRARYAEQFDEPNFKSLVNNPKIKVHAIWDDHDFGSNNCHGAEIDDDAYKAGAKALFFKYMLFGERDPATATTVYHAFEDADADVKFIMLDTRMYRQKPGPSNSILGKDQEDWFEAELNGSTRDITVVCSGSVLAKGGDEQWQQYEKYYEKIVKAFKAKGKVLFLAGDIHRNAFNKHDGFFEAISSAVARGSVINPAIRNNYGIIEFKDDAVDIRFRGERAKDTFDVSIDRASWTTDYDGGKG